MSALSPLPSSDNSVTVGSTQMPNPYKNTNTPSKKAKTTTKSANVTPEATSGSVLGASVGTPQGDRPLTSIKKRKEGPVQPRLTQLGFTSENEKKCKKEQKM
jgi:hypothetical protein